MKAVHAMEELERALAAERQAFQDFIYSVSHDLGAPLRAVVNFSKLLDEKYRPVLDEKGLRYLAFIVDGGGKAQAMLAGLLDYSRLNTQVGAFSDVDMSALVERCLATLRERIRQCGAQIAIASPLPAVSGDPEQLACLWHCLLDNALKFRKEGEAPSIRISAETLAEGWRFCVRDNGIGIDPKFHTRIFGLFKRLHTDEEYEGIGIGLTLAQKIVERHGGKLWVESAPGQGATFWFTLMRQEGVVHG